MKRTPVQASVTSSCGSIRMSFENNENLFDRLEDESVSIILTDPPYKYLKNQKLEVDFDEKIFFDNCKRVLKKNGFIILFGRGVSFYRWNTILDDLGFSFKEEIIWNKSMGTSPLMNICRIHETVSVFSKKTGIINKVKIPYLHSKNYDLNKIQSDFNRIIGSLNNPNSLQFLNDFLKQKRSDMELNTRFTKHKVTSDVRKTGAREVNTIASIINGITEKTIIEELRDHYTSIHPTQKPVRLLERLLLLVKKSDNDIVLDPFGGSFSTMEAVYNLGLNGITCELDLEYFEAGKNRILELTSQQRMLL